MSVVTKTENRPHKEKLFKNKNSIVEIFSHAWVVLEEGGEKAKKAPKSVRCVIISSSI